MRFKLLPGQAEGQAIQNQLESRNKHLRLIEAVFSLAMDDGILARSPIEGVKEAKVEKPIRQTPSLAEFQAIVGSVRSQPFADTREESADFVEFLGLAGLGLAEATAMAENSSEHLQSRPPRPQRNDG